MERKNYDKRAVLIKQGTGYSPKRLTRWSNETESAELVDYDKEEWAEFVKSLNDLDSVSIRTAIDKLAEYEDLEEQKKIDTL